MLRLSIHRAATGMVLAMPVLLPQKPEHILLKPGARLDSDSIQRLMELNVRTLCIEHPPTAHLLRYCSPAIAQHQVALASKVGECIDSVVSGVHGRFDFLSYLTAIRSLVAQLVDSPEAAIFTEDIVDAPQHIIGHSFNVGVLSLLMGLKLDGYLVASRRRVDARRAQSVENLGLGALLHDIGLLKLDISAPAASSGADLEDPAWRDHVVRGYELVKGRVPPTAAACVLHHHQRLDGSGFPAQRRTGSLPSPLAGKDIHVFTRIVAVADVFNRFRRPPSQPGVVEPTVRALKNTLDLVRQGKLDPVAFRALLNVVPAFAPGSVVQLNDSRTYVVTDFDPADPCRPVVSALAFDEVLYAGASPHTPPAPIDLRQRTALRVVRADGHSVSEDLFQPAFGGEFDLHAPYPWHLIAPPQAA